VTDDEWPAVRANIETKILERWNAGNKEAVPGVFSTEG
jgi:hypothetical protein